MEAGRDQQGPSAKAPRGSVALRTSSLQDLLLWFEAAQEAMQRPCPHLTVPQTSSAL